MATRPASPGVHRSDEQPAAAPGLATGVPAFFGFADGARCATIAGPFRRPALFRDGFSAAADRVGAKTAMTPVLFEAVGGFFQNGGQACYAVLISDARDAAGAALTASLDEGFDLLATVDDVDLVAAPDLAYGPSPAGPGSARWDAPPLGSEALARLQQRLIDGCDRDGRRFAVLDGPGGAGADALLEHRGRLVGANAALYAPWLLLAGDGGARAQPPCGHVAGAISATDHAAGVFKAPANVALQGAIGFDVAVGQAEQERLNPSGVNALRAFPGRGIRIWGARTISDDPSWRYVNVRRLFIQVRRWLERAYLAVAFEPNDGRLWSRISREATDYLASLMLAGAFRSAAADESFYVKCDDETNPPEVRDAGIVVAEIGLAPAVPGEFIVFRMTASTSGVAVAAID